MSYFYEETVTLPQLIEHFSERNGDAYPFHDEGTREVGKTIYFMDEPLRIKEHAEAVEAEFRESMTMRARKGYVLPSQMKLLYGGEEVAARLPQGRIVTEGSQVLLGGNDRYVAMCHRCWREKIARQRRGE